MKLYSRTFIIVVLSVILTMVISKVDAQNTEAKKDTTIPDSVLAKYDTLSQKITTIYDTTFKLSDSKKNIILDMNYTYWVDTHHDRMKLDSLMELVEMLKNEVHKRDNQRIMGIRRELVEKGDRDQAMKFKEARKLERAVVAEEERKGRGINNLKHQRMRRRAGRTNKDEENLRKPQIKE